MRRKSKKKIKIKIPIGRVVNFIILTGVLSMALYFQYGTTPFIAIPSKSMEPVFQIGDLVIAGNVHPSKVSVGDVLVIKVPKLIRDKYHYPPSIVHRVTKVESNGNSLLFRIKGDNNNAEDPFTIFPENIIGKVRTSYNNLGFPILFLHSQHGLYLVISVSMIYLMYILLGVFENKKLTFKRGLTTYLFSDLVLRIEKIEKNQEKQNELLEKLIDSLNNK